MPVAHDHLYKRLKDWAEGRSATVRQADSSTYEVGWDRPQENALVLVRLSAAKEYVQLDATITHQELRCADSRFENPPGKLVLEERTARWPEYQIPYQFLEDLLDYLKSGAGTPDRSGQPRIIARQG